MDLLLEKLLINFVKRQFILNNENSENYDPILVIIYYLIKIVYFQSLIIIIDYLRLVEVIVNIIIWYHNFSDLIIFDKSLLFISKFWLLFCYFFIVKQRLSTVFLFQIDKQIKYQNNIIKIYFRIFVTFEQNDRAKFLLMAKFIYNNI